MGDQTRFHELSLLEKARWVVTCLLMVAVIMLIAIIAQWKGDLAACNDSRTSSITTTTP